MILLEILLSVIVAFALYTLIIGFSGLFTPPLEPPPAPEKRFCVIIPAHNEELVIGELLGSIRQLEYPQHLYDVVVVADNCTDCTAEMARRSGAAVLERTDSERRGKGYAVRYALDRLGFLDQDTEPASHDAVVLFDADNLVKPNFLEVMNARLLAGEHLIQCFVDSKNPTDTWISSAYSIMFWLNSRFTLLARHNLGLSAVFMGTGMCISASALRDVGWNTKTLTEDLEYSIQAVELGYRTRYTHHTCIYDEKPLTFAASWRQRLRWARGQLNVLFVYAPRLITAGLTRPCIVRLEAGTRICQLLVLLAAPPVMWLYYGFLGADGFAGHVVSSIPALPLVMTYLPYFFLGFIFMLDEPPTQVLKYVPLYPLFTLSWLIILGVGLCTRRERRWMPTRHTRVLKLSGLRRAGDHLRHPEEHRERTHVEEVQAQGSSAVNQWIQ